MTEQLNFSFGGKINVRVVDQEEYWRDIRGYTWKISEMETSHIQNCLGYLERNAERFWAYYLFKLPGTVDIYFGRDDLWEDDDLTAIPQDWIQSTPLYEAMEAELERRARKPNGSYILD